MTMEEDRAKLMHLIDHWVEHNRSHEASYSEWAGKAHAMGDDAAGELIMLAVGRMQEADDLLTEALNRMRARVV
jgi:nickel/cobalt exporter